MDPSREQLVACRTGMSLLYKGTACLWIGIVIHRIHSWAKLLLPFPPKQPVLEYYKL